MGETNFAKNMIYLALKKSNVDDIAGDIQRTTENMFKVNTKVTRKLRASEDQIPTILS